MIKASKISKTSTPGRATRQRRVWCRPDLGGRTDTEWWHTRLNNDFSPMGAKSSKTYAQCKNKNRFSDCTTRIRMHKEIDGEAVVEQTGQHAHDWEAETFSAGLPQRYKTHID